MGHRVSLNDFIRLKESEKQVTVVQAPVLFQTGFDYLQWPVVRPTPNCDWEIDMMEWGFLPDYVRDRAGAERFRKGYKDFKGKFIPGMTTLNAKGEELLLPGKIFRESALERRCLVIASFFYEWKHVYPVGKRGEILKTAVKYPHYIGLKDKKYFFIAGVWRRWEDQRTHEIADTFALCTTAANSLMEEIHNSQKRMPTILSEDLALEWISDALPEERITQIATWQIPSEEMEAWTINKKFSEMEEPTQKFVYPEMEQNSNPQRTLF